VEGAGVDDEQPTTVHPLVSVVMPVRNGLPWIQQQLEALVAQELAVDWELVAADNGSDDGTRSCLQQWSHRYSHVHVVDASARRGAAAARNAGVQVARGSLLAFCDADDVVRPGWLASLTAALDDADLVAGVFDFQVLDGSPRSAPVPAATQQMGFLPFALGANLAVRREAFEAVHGFSEDLSPGEDVDLCWRLQLAGYRFAVATGAAVDKRERAGGGPMFRAAWAYGWCGAPVYGRYRPLGMQRDLRGALKGWVWLVVAVPGLLDPRRRRQWVRTLGIRLGSLASSIRHRVFFP